MILCDVDIAAALAEGSIVVDPLTQGSIQPASLELHLAEEVVLAPQGQSWQAVDHPLNVVMDYESTPEGGRRLLVADFQLGHTVEVVKICDGLAAQVNGKSSLGRLGLLVHATAGFVDPGFTGQLTLELKNLTRHTMRLRAGMAIAQLVFHKLTQPAQRPYGHPDNVNHYQGQRGATKSVVDDVWLLDGPPWRHYYVP